MLHVDQFKVFKILHLKRWACCYYFVVHEYIEATYVRCSFDYPFRI